MINKDYGKIFYLLLIAFYFVSCGQNKEHNKVVSEKNPIANSTAKEMSYTEASLPHAAGEEVFKANCITCHSLRYIQMQPDFPKKSWEKIVDKMIKNFGAPISDSSAKIIVNYLAEIKGKK